MGIFEANIRGHAADEDILTCSVFGALEILDSSKFLVPILQKCGAWPSGLDYPTGFLFEYWKSVGKRTPDVIIRSNMMLIFVECKLGSPVDVQQLVEEYEDGIVLGKDFKLILVTADNSQPEAIDRANAELKRLRSEEPQLKWISWQQIYAAMKEKIESCGAVEKKLVQDVLSLLKSKGLSVFERFQANQISSMAHFYPEMASFLQECSAFFGTLSSRLKETDILCEDSIRTGYITRRLGSPRYWVPRWLGFRAWDKTWQQDLRQCLLVLLLLDPLELNIGYRLAVGGENRKLWKMFSDAANNKRLAGKLQKSDCTITLYGGDFARVAEISKDQIEQTLATRLRQDVDNIVIGWVFNSRNIHSPDLLSEAEKCLVKMRNIVKEENLYFPVESIGKIGPAEDMEDPSGDG